MVGFPLEHYTLLSVYNTTASFGRTDGYTAFIVVCLRNCGTVCDYCADILQIAKAQVDPLSVASCAFDYLMNICELWKATLVCQSSQRLKRQHNCMLQDNTAVTDSTELQVHQMQGSCLLPGADQCACRQQRKRIPYPHQDAICSLGADPIRCMKANMKAKEVVPTHWPAHISHETQVQFSSTSLLRCLPLHSCLRLSTLTHHAMNAEVLIWRRGASIA